MKTITVPPEVAEINALLEQARQGDVLVRAADGREFVLVAVEDDSEDEVARTRENARLMTLLDERVRQSETIPLDEVKRRLGLSD